MIDYYSTIKKFKRVKYFIAFIPFSENLPTCCCLRDATKAPLKVLCNTEYMHHITFLKI